MEKHNLQQEFPQFQEKITKLKVNDTHFKTLFDQYYKIENQIHKINTGEEVAIDEFAHELKSKLLHLKDEIYSYLNK